MGNGMAREACKSTVRWVLAGRGLQVLSGCDSPQICSSQKSNHQRHELVILRRATLTVQFEPISAFPNLRADAIPMQLLRSRLQRFASSGTYPEKGSRSGIMRPLHRLALLCFALVFLSGVFSVAQNTAPKPLIVEKVNENQLITLRGNTPPAAIGQNDRGRVSPAMSMSGLILVLRRSPEQQAAFDAFVASQYDATSPNYHHWLEPEEVGEKFGPAMADIATVSSWLSSHGLSVEAVSKDRMTIRFSGSASQVEETFHTEIHNLVVKGEPHISNMSDPQIPMALEPVVLGPKALHNFIPKALHRTGGKVTQNRETGKWQPAPDSAAGGLRPNFGFTTCGTSPCLIEDVAPFDFATIYNVLPLWNASTPIDGTGQTIAIAGRSDVRAADVTAFRSTFGLPAGTFNMIHNLETGTVDPGYCTGTTGNCTLDDQIENALDVEWSGAVAKGATVDLVVTQQTNTNDAIFDSASVHYEQTRSHRLSMSAMVSASCFWGPAEIPRTAASGKAPPRRESLCLWLRETPDRQHATRMRLLRMVLTEPSMGSQ